jgi:hypothetical protein
MAKSNIKTKEMLSSVSRKPELSGLCVNCQHSDTCIYLRNANRPVLQCEEFEIAEALPARATVNKILSTSNPRSRTGLEDKVSTRFKGLCKNCDNRLTCTLPRPESGVWHCEEYL